MVQTDSVLAVIRMQDYIHQNIDSEMAIEDICLASAYSRRHALRLFKKHLGKTVLEYVRDFRLSRATVKLSDESNQESILRIALASGFESHEGFTKAFRNHFGVLPNDYRKRRFPRGYTKPAPMSYYYLSLRSKGMNSMSEGRTVTATYITKPASKMIIKRGVLATDYFSYCDEIGCEIWDTLEKLQARVIWLQVYLWRDA